MWNFDSTENGAIRVRSRRFLDHLNRNGENPNFWLFLFLAFLFRNFPIFFPFRGDWVRVGGHDFPLFSPWRGGWVGTRRGPDSESRSVGTRRGLILFCFFFPIFGFFPNFPIFFPTLFPQKLILILLIIYPFRGRYHDGCATAGRPVAARRPAAPPPAAQLPHPDTSVWSIQSGFTTRQYRRVQGTNIIV